MRRHHKFKRTTLITVGLFSFLIGLAVSRIVPSIDVALVVLLSVLLLLSARRRGWLSLLVVVLFSSSCGLFRGAQYSGLLQPYREITGSKVVIEAKVQSDSLYNQQKQLSFDVDDIKIVDPIEASAPGRVAVSGNGERAVFRGDTLRIEGNLSATRGSRQARLSFSEFSVIERNPSVVESIRRQFVAGIATALPEPSASFGLGLLIGYRASLPESTNEQLAIVGLTHIIAVSGYNLTIIVRAIRRGLKNWSKYQQTVIAAGLIILFLLVTDFGPSIVRASIVSGLSLLAWYYGRTFKPMVILGLAAALTAGYSPLYLWSDIGWYLSFLAFFGILVVSPLVARLIYGKRKEMPQLGLILIETTAAQIMTAPLILYIFSTVSIIGVLSNLVVGPLIPIAMLLTLLAGLTGILSPVLAGFIAWPARMLLRYILDLVSVFASVPHAMIQRSASLAVMIFMYVAVLVFILLARRAIMTKYGTITDKNMII